MQYKNKINDYEQINDLLKHLVLNKCITKK